MALPVPATVAGGFYARIPAAFFAVAPGGVLSLVGIFPVPPTFPFGVPVTLAGGTFIVIPSAAFATSPVI